MPPLWPLSRRQSRSGGFALQRADTSVFDLSGGVDIDPKAHGRLETRAQYASEDFDVRIVDDTTTFVANPHVTAADDVGASARWSMPVGRVLDHVTAGADLRRVDGADTLQVGDTPGPIGVQRKSRGNTRARWSRHVPQS